MTLPLSGPITLGQICTEFILTDTPRGLDALYSGGSHVPSGLLGYPNGVATPIPATGTLSFSNFYGARNEFRFTVNSNRTNADARSLALSAGWNGDMHVVATVAPGVILSSTTTAIAALTVAGSFPNGVALINLGSILGLGGGGGVNFGGFSSLGGPGGVGGPGLKLSTLTSVDNSNGLIGGGGGGGGAAGSPSSQASYFEESAGGGGGAGFGIGGACGAHEHGHDGTANAGGAGGVGYAGVTGGAGGSLGEAGETGGTGDHGTLGGVAGGAGGAGGNSIQGTDFLIWGNTNQGSVLGALTSV